MTRRALLTALACLLAVPARADDRLVIRGRGLGRRWEPIGPVETATAKHSRSARAAVWRIR